MSPDMSTPPALIEGTGTACHRMGRWQITTDWTFDMPGGWRRLPQPRTLVQVAPPNGWEEVPNLLPPGAQVQRLEGADREVAIAALAGALVRGYREKCSEAASDLDKAKRLR